MLKTRQTNKTLTMQLLWHE